MKYKPYNVKPYYTGGNIWVFVGNVSKDKWFSTANPDWFIDIYDADPNTYDEEIGDFLDYEWQEEHRVDSFEDDNFCIDVLKQALKADPYNDRDFEYLLKYDFNVNESVSKNITSKRGKSGMKLKIVERQLNEGPGAGYTVKTFGINNVKINSIKYVRDFENGSIYSIEGTATIDGIQADSYYYGTGLIDIEIPVYLSYVWISNYDLNSIDALDDDALIELATDCIYEDADTEFVYGGGYTHSKYDGQVGEVDRANSSYWQGYIDKDDVIHYIDEAVRGDNTFVYYIVELDGYDFYSSYDSEKEAISDAQELVDSGKYDEVKVKKVTEYIGYDGDPIEEFGDTHETVWEYSG